MVLEQRLDIEDIKKLYPDEWVLLDNPKMNESEISPVSGVVLYHSADKKEVCYLGREKKSGYDTFTLIYTGKSKYSRAITSIVRKAGQ